MLKGEALDNYVQELRKKTILFKKYRAEQSRVTTETGILRRTQEVEDHIEVREISQLISIYRFFKYKRTPYENRFLKVRYTMLLLGMFSMFCFS